MASTLPPPGMFCTIIGGLPVTVDDGDGGVVNAVIDVGLPLPHAA